MQRTLISENVKILAVSHSDAEAVTNIFQLWRAEALLLVNS